MSRAGEEMDEGSKVSSTLQELVVCESAVRYWVRTRAEGSAQIFTYRGDCDNVRFLFKKWRSKVVPINEALKRIGQLIGPKGLAVRIVWHSRESVLGRAADALSRCDVAGFQVLMPAPPAGVLAAGEF